MVFSITLAEDSGHFRMYLRNAGILRIKTGFISILMAILTIMMVYGMKAGKAIMIW